MFVNLLLTLRLSVLRERNHGIVLRRITREGSLEFQVDGKTAASLIQPGLS